MKTNKLVYFFFILCVIQIFYIFQFRSGFKYEVFRKPFDQDSGIIYALSPKVVELRDILKKYDLNEFNLSESIKEDTYMYQRSIEFNYPIRMNKDSKKIFYFIDEKVSSSCDLIETGKYIKLIKC